MKFDMGRAWSDAVAMLMANKDLVIIMAAVFLFLPSLVLAVIAPGTELEQAAQNPEAMQAALVAYFAENWPVMLIYGVVSTIGTLAILALLGRSQRPTVGEAIGIGAKAMLPYLAASLVLGFAIGVAAMLVGLVAATAGAAVGAILGIVVLILAILVMFRMILVAPVMAIEGKLNPIGAIQRSWSLVKGNTRYVIAFILLLMVALIVVSLVTGIVFSLISAMAGSGEVAIWIDGILSSLMGAVFSLLLLAVYAAIHRQLAGPSAESLSETFD